MPKNEKQATREIRKNRNGLCLILNTFWTHFKHNFMESTWSLCEMTQFRNSRNVATHNFLKIRNWLSVAQITQCCESATVVKWTHCCEMATVAEMQHWLKMWNDPNPHGRGVKLGESGWVTVDHGPPFQYQGA
jgi:hypothetical protein